MRSSLAMQHEANVNARYFFDAPAGDVEVHWALVREAGFFLFAGL